MASNRMAMASNLRAMASNRMAMASNLLAMASNLIAMASNLIGMPWNPKDCLKLLLWESKALQTFAEKMYSRTAQCFTCVHTGLL